MSASARDEPLHANKEALLELLLAEQAAGASPARTRIERSGVERAPLSSAQQRLWLLYELAPESPAYNLTTVFRARGTLSLEALRNALATIIDRHEILRTTFDASPDGPVQIIHGAIAIPLTVEDLTSAPDIEAAVQTRIHDEADKPFNLRQGPALRVCVLRLRPDQHVLLISAHHIVYDGWSLGIFVDELAKLYQAECAGQPAMLPPLSLQYVDYALWENQQDFRPQRDYWTCKLAAVPHLELLGDRPRPSSHSSRGAWHAFALPKTSAGHLRQLGRSENATLFMVLLAAFHTLLFRYSGQDDFAVGVPIANRRRSELEGLIGFFVNTLALRAPMGGDPTFRELLRRVRDTVSEAFNNQEAPFNQVVEALHPERSALQMPLVRTMFGLQNAPAGALDLQGLTLEPIKVDRRAAKFDLVVLLHETPDGLEGEFEYSADLFERGTIERMARHFGVLLEAIAASPQARISQLALLAAHERTQVLVGWNRTATAYPADRCIHELFEAEARRDPDATAVVFGEERLSYGALDARANALARRLRALGVGDGRTVALVVERSVEMVVALLGILKAGYAYAPLSPDDPDERLSLLLADLAPAAILTQGRFAGRLRGAARCPVLCLDEMDWPQFAAAGAEGAPRHGSGPDGLAYVLYTSGSTGAPKGVCVHHRSVVRLVKDTGYVEFGRSDVFLQLAPLAFDASTFELWGALLNGGTLAVAPPGRLSLAEIGAAIRRYRVSTLWLTAGLFQVMVDERLSDLSPLRQLLVGGDVLPVAHVRRALAALPECRLINGYGPTENTTFTCCHAIAEPLLGSVPIGRPIANTRVYILDGQLQPVPVGVAGELCTSGAGLARGYLNRPDLTAERFIANPFSGFDGESRLYRTGDTCRYLADGTIEFLGRRDQQVKIRGFRVEPGEIETAIVTHHSIQQAAVMYADARLAAYVVPAPGAFIDSKELKRYLDELLPDYMVPADFAVIDELPLNTNGKVDRERLPAVTRSAGADFAAPRTETEKIVADIWAETLGSGPVGISANFFDLGGHSLMATQVVSRLRTAFGVEVPLRLLFASPTVRALAEHVDAARRHSMPAPTIGPVPRTGAMALSFAQERLWFLDQLEPGNPFYNVPIALSLKGTLDLSALQSSIDILIQRHEVLRTTFPAVDGRPVQAIAKAWPVTVPVVDLCHLRDASQADEATRLIEIEAKKPFDLARGPLLRTQLLRLALDDHVLLFTMHHIVADGWALGVLVNEMAPLYRAYHSGEPALSVLPELGIQYADFAAWQRNWLGGEVLDQQLGYWRKQLGNAPPVLNLPTDRPRPPTQTYQGSSVHFRVDPAVAEAFRRLGRRNGSTLFMTLLAAFATLLYRYTGQDDIVIGSPISNRNRAEIEPLIGFFANTLALRLDLHDNPSFDELLRRARSIALDAYSHQDLPFERLVDELQLERDLSLNPLFQVMFTLQNAPLKRLDLPELRAELLKTRHHVALFDLVLDMWEEEGTLWGILAYNTDLFDDPSAARIVRNFQTLLTAIATDPQCRLDDLSLLAPDEQGALLELGRGPQRDYPVERTIQELFEEIASTNGERVAAVHDGASITYRELDARANQIGHRLRRLGVRPNDFVAILDHRGLDVLAAMLGILKAGGAFLPIDSAYPPDRIHYMLSDSQVQVLVSRTELVAKHEAARFGGGTLLLDTDDLADEPVSAPSHVSRSTDIAYMLYTSGSTGLPKGAMVRQNGAVNHIFAEFELLRLHVGMAFLQSAPSSSDISVWQFLAPVLIGGRTVIADYDVMCEPSRLFELMRSQRITLIELVPVIMKQLLDHVGRMRADERVLPALECAMVTGEAATPALINQWLATYPAVTLVNAYGPTEAADDICQAVLERPLSSDRKAVPIGRPVPNLTLYVLDRNLRLVPEGVSGEICVSGIGVGAGYWGNDQRTRESFLPNPYAGEGRGDVIYRTGDLGRWLADGTLECQERIDHQIKLRGFRIDLGELEGVLSAHPTVREAAVAVWDHAGDSELAAYVIPDGETSEVRQMLNELRHEQVDLWQDLHEDSYADELLISDPTFNVIGWDSNYTGLPLPAADMREYVDFTTERILALQPKDVLEIGCGTGLIMFALLPHCGSYSGTDLSQMTIRRLHALQARPELRRISGLDRAELSCRKADDVAWIDPGRFDTVILPSVVQYFPGIDYLLRVLDGIFERALKPGGSVFLGDVRSLPLLAAFHASVQFYKAVPADRCADVGLRTRRRLTQEQELAIDPGFFQALMQRFPAIRSVEILPKRGNQQNEMTRFRYDVVIRTAGASVSAGEVNWLEWRHERPGVEELRRKLIQKPVVLALRGIANPRVQEALFAVECLLDGNRHTTIEDAKSVTVTRQDIGIEPEDLWRLGDECGYRVDLSLAAGRADASYDAVFRPIALGDLPPPAWDVPAVQKPWSAYANNPLEEKLGRRMAPRLREYLKQKLPHYMVPSSFTLLAHLPLTPAGKLDRRALLPPDLSERISDESYVAPRSREEQALARIWAEVLGLARVGIHNNFFELGGHSLKATQVVSRVQQEFGIQVALRDLFSHPTIAELAPSLLSAQTTPVADIPKAAEASHYPLSHGQRRLWVLSQMEGASAAYNMPIAVILEGSLDVASFQQAFSRLVERHQSLRTAFVVVGDMPRQQILRPHASKLEIIDLTGEPNPEDAARELALRDSAGPFDLEQAPMRASLLRLADERFVLLLNMHHIVSDDWSLNVLIRDFVHLYANATGSAVEALQPLRLQYRDFACWQNDYLAGPAAAPHREYWHHKLAGTLPILNLATDMPRPPVRTYHGHTLGFRLDTTQVAALSVLSREHRASQFMTLVAIVKVLLHRYTGQDEILVGFPIAGRNHPDLEDQVGFYLNTLPLRQQVRGDCSFIDLLAAVKTTATEAYEHQDYPFDRLVDELNLVRDVSRSPMFDVVVVMQNASSSAAAPSLRGLAVRPFIRKYEVAKFDLSFTFEEHESGLQVDITYNTDLFLAARIRKMADHLRALVTSALADPLTPIARLPMLSEAERRQFLAVGIPNEKTIPRHRGSIVDLFERRAALAPTSAALVMPATAAALAFEGAAPRASLTYGELNARANQLAHCLRSLGVGPDVIVGLCLPRSLDLIVAILGILKSGGAYLPMDTMHPPERWQFMADDAQPRVVLTQQALAGTFSGLPAQVLCIDSDAAMLDAKPRHNPEETARADQLAYVIYTSGSTGQPKGVAVTRHNVSRLFATSETLFGFNERDVWTLFHSCAFDFSVWELWGALLYGGRLVIVPHAMSRSPNDFYQLLADESVTVLNQTPSAFRQLIQVEDEAAACRDLALRYVVFGGEALDMRTLRPWFARHGESNPRLINMYGITETTVHVTYRPLSEADSDESGSRIGGALPDLRLYLLDSQREPVPIGVPGELYVGGEGVARGYLNRPELTADRFVADPFSSDPHARLYRSGDLGRFAGSDGDIEYLGRIDHQVQVRGFRVELGEIEAALASHQDVREAVVLPVGADAEMRLVGYYIPAAGQAPAFSALRHHLAARLPDYMVPAAFVAVDAFPMTPNGKLDREALPRPAYDRPHIETAFIAPVSELERLIAATLQDVLKTDKVGLHDNFFELGANSLLLVQAHRTLRERLGRDLPVIHLFQYPTVAALAEALAGRGPHGQTAATQEIQERVSRRRAARDRRRAAGVDAQDSSR